MQAATVAQSAVKSSQAVMQATTEGQANVLTNQAVMLVSFAPPGTRSVRSSQVAMLASSIAELETTVKTNAVAMLVAYRTGSVENLNLRSWTYSLDGHTFYVLTIGEQGTFVYDESTGKWARFQTTGLSGWNMEIGTTWKGKVIAADQSNPTIWEMDPTSFIDDGYKTQTRVVTGALSMRNRAFIPNYAFRVTASLGTPDVAGTLPATDPSVLLEISDDQGKSYQSMGEVVIATADYVQELQWLSLGTMNPPMRIFRVTDTGAIARIDGGDSEVGEEGS